MAGDEVAASGAVVNLADLEETNADEYGVSQNQLRVANPYAQGTIYTQKALQALIGVEPAAATERTVVRGEGAGAVTFTLRRRSSTKIWSFPKADAEKVAALVNAAQGAGTLTVAGVNRADLEQKNADEYGASHSPLRVANPYAQGADLVREALQSLIGVDPDAATERTVVRGEGAGAVTFTLRWNGRRKVWSFPKADAEKVAALVNAAQGAGTLTLAAVSRAERVRLADLEEMNADEYGASKPQFTVANPYAQGAEMVRDAVQTLIGVEPDAATERTVVRGEGAGAVTFTLRRNATSKTWSFRKEDAEKVAALVNAAQGAGTLTVAAVSRAERVRFADLEVTTADEYGASRKQLTVRNPYAQGADLVRDALQSLIGVEPAAATERTVVRGEGAGAVTFTLRRSGNQKGWSFPKADAEKVAALVNAAQGAGTLTVAAVSRAERVPRADLEEMKADEYGVNKNQLRVTNPYAQGAEMVRDAVQTLIGVDPDAATERTVLRGEGAGAVTFALRRSGSHKIWSFRKEDAEKVAALVNAAQGAGTLTVAAVSRADLVPHTDLEEMNADEYGASEKKIKIANPYAQGAPIVREALQTLIGVEPEAATERTVVRGEGAGAVTFTLRRSAFHKIWSFPKADAEKVAALVNAAQGAGTLTLGAVNRADLVRIANLEEINADEYGASEKKIKIANPYAQGAQMVREAVQTLIGVDPDAATERTVVRGEGAGAVTFTLRRSGPHKIWSFRKEDAGKVAVLAGLTLMMDWRKEIDRLGLEEAVRLLGAEPTYLYDYLAIMHPEIAAGQRIELVQVVVEGLLGGGGWGVNGETSEEMARENYLTLLKRHDDLVSAARRDGNRGRLLRQSVEKSLLIYFTEDEAEGFAELERRINTLEKGSALRSLLEEVREEFRKIARIMAPRETTRLYFYQKWTIHQIRREMAEGIRQGLVVSLEQGLGKTLVALVVMAAEAGARVFAPNTLVSTWATEADRFVKEGYMGELRGAHEDRDKALAGWTQPALVTGIPYLREMPEERVNLLKAVHQLLVFDEADFTGSADSQQSRGARQLSQEEFLFRLLLTGTPFQRGEQIPNLLSLINQGMRSGPRTFGAVFDLGERGGRLAARLLMMENMIRLRKEDVFRTVDPSKPVEAQPHRLPAKVFEEKAGRYPILPEQMEQLRQLFLDREGWMTRHWERIGRTFSEDDLYNASGFLSMWHLYQRIVNDPGFYGSTSASPKHMAVKKIVDTEIGEKGAGKVMIFVRYRSEVEAYQELLKGYGVATYYGGVRRDSSGYAVDATGSRLLYVVENGIPRESVDGDPMLALDVERLKYLNDPSIKVMVGTYASMSAGLTLPSDAVILSDETDLRDTMQGIDRAHRIGMNRAQVRYYELKGQYDADYLKGLPEGERALFGDKALDEQMAQWRRGMERVYRAVMDGMGAPEAMENIETAMEMAIPGFRQKQKVGEAIIRDPLSETSDKREDVKPYASATWSLWTTGFLGMKPMTREEAVEAAPWLETKWTLFAFFPAAYMLTAGAMLLFGGYDHATAALIAGLLANGLFAGLHWNGIDEDPENPATTWERLARVSWLFIIGAVFHTPFFVGAALIPAMGALPLALPIVVMIIVGTIIAGAAWAVVAHARHNRARRRADALARAVVARALALPPVVNLGLENGDKPLAPSRMSAADRRAVVDAVAARARALPGVARPGWADVQNRLRGLFGDQGDDVLAGAGDKDLVIPVDAANLAFVEALLAELSRRGAKNMVRLILPAGGAGAAWKARLNTAGLRVDWRSAPVSRADGTRSIVDLGALEAEINRFARSRAERANLAVLLPGGALVEGGGRAADALLRDVEVRMIESILEGLGAVTTIGALRDLDRISRLVGASA